MTMDEFKRTMADVAQMGTDLAQKGAAKTRQLAQIARLKAANLGEEQMITKAYTELGKLYFAKYGEQPEEDFAAAVSTIVEGQAAIAANHAEIAAIKAQNEPEVEVEIIVDAPEEEEAPAEEPAAEAEETPAEEPVAAAEETPAEEPAAEAEETPVEEPAAAAEEAPAEEPAEADPTDDEENFYSSL